MRLVLFRRFEGPVNNPSIRKESFTWIVPLDTLSTRVELGRDIFGCRHRGVGNDGRIRNLLKKTQGR